MRNIISTKEARELPVGEFARRVGEQPLLATSEAMYAGVTDPDWFANLAERSPEIINFWVPSGNRAFFAVKKGDLFLFKLKGQDAIVGYAEFYGATNMTIDAAWELFGADNGVASLQALRDKILGLRYDKSFSPMIGVRMLLNPVFWTRDKWITPPNWNWGIVQGRRYSIGTEDNLYLRQAIEARKLRS